MQHLTSPREQDKSQRHCPPAPITLLAACPRVLKDHDSCSITILCSVRQNFSSSDTSNSNHTHGYPLLPRQTRGPLSAFSLFQVQLQLHQTLYAQQNPTAASLSGFGVADQHPQISLLSKCCIAGSLLFCFSQFRLPQP